MKRLPNRERRNLLLALAAGAAGALPLGAHAQQDTKLRRIGFLAVRSRPTAASPNVYLDAFVQALRELGHAEGRNLVIEWRFAEGRYERLPALAAELVRLKPEVIATHSTPATLALQKATSTIPIVVASMGDPVASGVTKSLGRPSGNVTGMSIIAADVYRKQLELLKTLIPKLSRVAALSNPQGVAGLMKSVQDAGSKLGIHVVSVSARNAAELERAFAEIAQQRAEAVIVSADAIFVGLRREIVDLAMRNRLPTMFYYRENAEGGGLMSYGQNVADHYRRAAGYVDRILRGARPGDLPFEQPTKLHLAINQKTANALGIKVSKEFLFRADEVFE